MRHLVLFTLLFCGSALGQSPSASPPPVAFQVASVHPHRGPLRVTMGFSSSGSRVTLEGYTQSLLIQEAYSLKPYQVFSTSGAGPKDDIYYDITARAAENTVPSRSDFRLMLQTLLAQRFNLKFHRETRELPVYALTVDKKGPKLQPSAPDASETGFFGVHGRNQTIEVPRDSMDALADQIAGSFVFGRPVVDRTGLPGTYAIKFEATPEFRIGHDSQPEDISVFTAVQEQLGLRLEPAKAAVPVLVIEHIDIPSEN